MLSSPLSMNTSKIHLSMEYSHWKQSRDWRKDSSMPKPVEKDHTESQRKGGDAVRSEPVPQGGDTGGGGRQRLKDLPWGVRGLNRTLGTPPLRFKTRKMEPPYRGLKTSGPHRRTVRNWGFPQEEYAHMCLLPVKGRGTRLNPPRAQAGFLQLPQRLPQPTPGACSSPSCPGAAPRGAKVEESGLLCGMESAWTQHSMWTGYRRPRLAPAEAADQARSGSLIGVLWPSQHVPKPGAGDVRFGSCCSSTALFWGEGTIASSGENVLKGNGISSDLPLRASVP